MGNFGICKSKMVFIKIIMIAAASLTGVITLHQEVLVNESTSISCFSKKVKSIQWHHTPPGKSNKYVYAGGRFYYPYNTGRFLVDNDLTTNVYILVINNVIHEDAGLYECKDDVLSEVFSSTRLTVLDSSPVCTSNMNLKGFIGLNTCNIKQENMTFSCAVSFSGNSPNLMWSTLNGSQSLNSPVCESKDNRINCSLFMKADLSFDGSTFICQTATSNDARHKCSIENIRVEYFLGDYEFAEKRVGDNITCMVASNLQIYYNWTKQQNNQNKIFSANRTVYFQKPGLYKCSVKYNIRDITCYASIVAAIVSHSVDDKETVTESCNFSIKQILLGFLMFLVAAVIAFFIYKYIKADTMNQTPESLLLVAVPASAVADKDTISAIMRNNYEFFKENIRPKKLIPKLAHLKILSDKEKGFISTLKSASAKNHEILIIIRQSLVKNYYEFINCLRETGQDLVANVAEKGGVTVKMTIFHESIEHIAEIEKEIVRKLNQLHESASARSEDRWCLPSQLKIRGIEILNARYNEGVVAWIWCRSSNAIAKLQQLNNDNKLEILFSALFRCLSIPTVPKINEVLWENSDVDFENLKLCKWVVKTSATMAGQKISGIAMMGNKIYAVSQNRSALLVFSCDEHGNTVSVKEEPLKTINTPMHLAASLSLRCLYITDRTSNDVYKVNVDPEGKVNEPILWVKGSSAEQVNSLSVGGDNNLLVLKEGKPNRLEIYNKDAKWVNELKLPDRIKHPNNVAEASNGDFVIGYRSDLASGGICRITRRGEWFSRLDLGFKSRPIQGLSEDENSIVSSLSEGIACLKHLGHFTLDDEDQMYACDADQYVVFLNLEQSIEEAIEVKDLKNPYRIHYLTDKKELLLVHGPDQDSFSVLTSELLRME